MIEGPLLDAVKNAFIAAKYNGYSFEGWTDEAIASDMIDYDSYIEKYPLQDVISRVRYYRMEMDNNG